MAETAKPTPDYVLAGCTCYPSDAIETGRLTDAMRDHHGVELHSPYCPVGRYERERGKAIFTPLGTEESW